MTPETDYNESHLRPIDVARRWGVSLKTLERWRCEGTGPYYLKLGGQVRYRKNDLERYERILMRSRTDRRPSNAELEAVS